MLLPRITEVESCKFSEVIQIYTNHLQFMNTTTYPWADIVRIKYKRAKNRDIPA